MDQFRDPTADAPVAGHAANFAGGTIAAATLTVAIGCSRGNSPSPAGTPMWGASMAETAMASSGLEIS